MKTSLIVKSAVVTSLVLLGASVQAQTLVYSVNGTGGTGGGSSSVTATPSTAPGGSSALTLIAGNNDYSFGTGVDGVAGESIVNSGTYNNGSGGDLAGNMGSLGTLSQLTLTMWINPSSSPAGNNERLLDISSGGSPTTGTADGNEVFFGINADGGLQFYANGVNPSSDTSGTTVFNGGMAQINSWYFLAVVYDTVNSVYSLYTGTTSSSATLQYSFTGLSGSSIAFGSTSSIFLANRPNELRTFPGSIDDVNLYSGAMTQSQLDALQVSEVPEPGTLALIGVGFGGLVARMRRQRS
ncbi:MAG: LamG-like jellyroll fold domain-containing protein [Verrucomicrobiota bacterium]